MFCPNCGERIEEESMMFCPNCGEKIMKKEEKKKRPKKEKKKKKWKIPVVIAIIAALVLGCFGYKKISQGKEIDRYVKLGNRYLKEMKYEDAVIEYNRALRIDKKSEKAKDAMVKTRDVFEKENKVEYKEDSAVMEVVIDELIEDKDHRKELITEITKSEGKETADEVEKKAEEKKKDIEKRTDEEEEKDKPKKKEVKSGNAEIYIKEESIEKDLDEYGEPHYNFKVSTFAIPEATKKAYPEFSKSLEAENASIKNDLQKTYNTNFEDELGEDPYVYCWSKLGISRNNNIFSFTRNYSSCGGNAVYYGMEDTGNIDVRTGKKLVLDNLVKDPDAFSEVIHKEVAKAMPVDIDEKNIFDQTEWEFYLETTEAKSLDDKFKWVIENDGIEIFFDKGDFGLIGPVPSVLISFEEYGDYFKDLSYLEGKKETPYILNEFAEEVDLNDDGKGDTVRCIYLTSEGLRVQIYEGEADDSDFDKGSFTISEIKGDENEIISETERVIDLGKGRCLIYVDFIKKDGTTTTALIPIKEFKPGEVTYIEDGSIYSEKKDKMITETVISDSEEILMKSCTNYEDLSEKVRKTAEEIIK